MKDFRNHFEKNEDYYYDLIDLNYIDEDDVRAANNQGGSYTYEQQQKALENIKQGVEKAYKKNKDNEDFAEFKMTFPKATKFDLRGTINGSFDKVDFSDADAVKKFAIDNDYSIDEITSEYNRQKTERDREEGKARRAKEIKDAPWYSPLRWATSDYAKQRYINEPEASLFGKEGTEGKWWQRGEDVSDLAFGAAGAVADLLPGLGAQFVGPAIRTGRDIRHSVNDDKYQKDAGTIAGDFAKDSFLNFGVGYMPTMIINRTKRAGKNVSKAESWASDVAEQIAADDAKKATQEGLKSLNTNEMLKDLADIEVAKRIRNMPDGPMKTDLMNTWNQTKSKDAISEHLAHWESVADDVPTGAVFTKEGNYKPGKAEHWKNTPTSDYVEQQAKAARAPKSTRWAAKGSEYAAVAGEPAVKASITLGGRGTKPEERADIDWFKDNYGDQWAAGFTPRGREDEPIMKAYREWQNENNIIQKTFGK